MNSRPVRNRRHSNDARIVGWIILRFRNIEPHAGLEVDVILLGIIASAGGSVSHILYSLQVRKSFESDVRLVSRTAIGDVTYRPSEGQLLGREVEL